MGMELPQAWDEVRQGPRATVEAGRSWDRRFVEVCFRAVATPAQMRRLAERIIEVADEAEIEGVRRRVGAKG